MNQMVDFGDRLRKVRLKTGLSQTDFAEKAGVTKKTQSLYERGERSPSAEYLSAIADLVDVSYLLTGNHSVTSVISPDEAALLDNYRHLCEEQKDTLNKVSQALSISSAVSEKAVK